MNVVFKWANYTKIWDIVLAWKRLNGRLPTYVDYNNYRIMITDLQTAYNNVKVFRNLHDGTNPTTVTVVATELGSTNTTRNVGPIQKAVEKILGPFNTLTGFANKCRGRGYGAYVNDRKTLEQEAATIANLNCVDGTQLLCHLGKEMGYEMHYVHVNCLKTGEGHVLAKVKGREFTNYIYIDLAAMMSVKTMATIGHGWCFDAIPVNGRVDESWLTRPDDGIT